MEFIRNGLFFGTINRCFILYYGIYVFEEFGVIHLFCYSTVFIRSERYGRLEYVCIFVVNNYV